MSFHHKDPDCPNCRGRSFSPYGDDDTYFECPLCQTLDEKFRAYYASKWPDVFDRWAQTDEGKRRLAA